MDSELALVIGLALVVLALPAGLAAWAEDRRPRGGLVLFFTGGALMLYASARKPGGYAPGDLPEVFYGVIARLL
jgi:hypothetical protein